MIKFSVIGMVAALIAIFFNQQIAIGLAGVAMWYALVEAIEGIELRVVMANFDPTAMVGEDESDERD